MLGLSSMLMRKATAAEGYQAVVESKSPSAYWHMDTSSGTDLIDYAGSCDLTLAGSYALSQPTIAGSSASIDFSGGYASSPGCIDLSSTDYTLELVVSLDSSQSNWFGLIGAGGADNDWMVQRQSNTSNLIIFHNGSNATVFSGKMALITDAANHHVVLTFVNSSKTFELWIDGASQGTATNPSAPSYNAEYSQFLAASRDPTVCSGVIDEAVIYTHKLSSADIGELFTATGI